MKLDWHVQGRGSTRIGLLGPLFVRVVRHYSEGKVVWCVRDVFGVPGHTLGQAEFYELRRAIEAAEELAGRALCQAQAVIDQREREARAT